MRLAIDGAKSIGYDLVEVATLNPRQFLEAADRTRRAFQEADLQIANSLGLPPDCDVNSEDRESVRRGTEILLDAVKVADAMGSRYVGGILYGSLQKYGRPTSTEARANAVRAVREAAGAAADRGITLGMEVVNRYESNLVNTAAQRYPKAAREPLRGAFHQQDDGDGLHL